MPHALIILPFIFQMVMRPHLGVIPGNRNPDGEFLFGVPYRENADSLVNFVENAAGSQILEGLGWMWHNGCIGFLSNSFIERLAAIVLDKPPLVYQVQMPPGGVEFSIARSSRAFNHLTRACQVNKLADSDFACDFRGLGEIERTWRTGPRSFQDVEVDHGGFHA